MNTTGTPLEGRTGESSPGCRNPAAFQPIWPITCTEYMSPRPYLATCPVPGTSKRYQQGSHLQYRTVPSLSAFGRHRPLHHCIAPTSNMSRRLQLPCVFDESVFTNNSGHGHFLRSAAPAAQTTCGLVCLSRAPLSPLSSPPSLLPCAPWPNIRAWVSYLLGLRRVALKAVACFHHKRSAPFLPGVRTDVAHVPPTGRPTGWRAGGDLRRRGSLHHHHSNGQRP